MDKSDGNISLAKKIWDNLMNSKETIYYNEGLYFTVAVNKYQNGIINLTIDGKPDASNDKRGDMITQVLLGHLPLLLHPKPERVLVIGLASGITLGMVTRWQNVKEIDCVEIEPSMIEAAHFFDQWNNQPFKDKRIRIILDDARNYLQFTKKKYDVIISEPSNPWVSGCGPLFSEENYILINKRLNKNGMVSTWVQMYNLRTNEYKCIVNTINSVFPNISIWHTKEADTIVLSTPEKLSINYEELKEKLKNVREDLKNIYLDNIDHLLAKFIGVPKFQHGFLNTDDRPAIEFLAGRNILFSQKAYIIFKMLRENAESITKYLSNFNSYENIIKIYINKGLHDLAEEILIYEFPNQNSDQYYNMAGYSSFRQNKYYDAINYFVQAIQKKPDYAEALMNLGNSYYRLKEYKKALYYTQKALKINPKNAEAYNIT